MSVNIKSLKEKKSKTHNNKASYLVESFTPKDSYKSFKSAELLAEDSEKP